MSAPPVRVQDIEVVEPDEELLEDEVDIPMDDAAMELAAHARKMRARIEASPGEDIDDVTMLAQQAPRRRGWLVAMGVLAVGAAAGAGGYMYLDRPQDGAGPQVATTQAAAVGAAVAAPVLENAPPPAAAIVAAPGPAVAPLEVPATTAAFVLRGIPDGTGVSLDGEPLGTGPMKVSRLTAGTHQLELIAPAGYQNRSVDVVLVDDQVVELTVALDPIAAEAPVAAEPSPVAAVADEPAEKAVASPKRERRAEPRAKEKNNKKDKKVAEVKAAKGEGTLMINAKPPCEIFVDGKKTGLTTPQRSLSLPAGTHKITLRNKEHGIERTAKTVVKPGETSRLVVDLTDEM